MEFKVYYADREFANERGDPLLGTVCADTVEEGQKKIARGEWATRTKEYLMLGFGYTLVPKAGRSVLEEELG